MASKHAPLPSPAELGFPSKFVNWHPEQIEGVDRTVFNPLRFTGLNMPTGSGKTGTGILVSLLHPEVSRALYLTSNKGLQDQSAEDFHGLGLVDLRGQRNYPCVALEPGGELDRYQRPRNGRTVFAGCDEGPCHSGIHCTGAPVRGETGHRPHCAYFGAVWDARHASIVSTNYSMYLNTAEHAGGLGHFDLLILDEAHDVDKELESFLTIELSRQDAEFIGTELPSEVETTKWRDWAKALRVKIQDRINARTKHAIKTSDGLYEHRRLKRLKGVIERIATLKPDDWIVENDGWRAQLSPITVSDYAERYLFRDIPHVLLMSATMTIKTTQLLGVPRDQLAFWEAPHRFPIEHRPIISINTYPPVRVDGRMHETTKDLWMTRIERILKSRLALNWNGIIHTVSYARMKDLVSRSDYKDHFIVHDSTNTRDQIQYFKAHPNEGLVLVSPSVVTGYDFPDDQCRFQIIGKVPMPDMRGAINKLRAELDKDYSGYLAMQKLVQACGRGVRNPSDWCETFIVDDHFSDWFLQRYRKHAPRWFRDAVYYVETIPEPFEFVA